MRRIVLPLEPHGKPPRFVVIAAWTLCVGLSAALLLEARLNRALEAQLAEMRGPGGDVAQQGHAATAIESQRLQLLSGHAALRFADWGSTFNALAASLPPGATVERVSLNARSGKAEVLVRLSKVADAAQTAESLSGQGAIRSPAVRRCDLGPTSAPDAASVRCEFEMAWGKVER